MAMNYSGLAGNTGVGPAVGTNLNADQLATQTAAAAANQQYLNAKLQGDADTLAFQKAQQAYTEAYNSAVAFGVSPGGTGMPAAGTPTMAQMKQWADLYGTAAAPANQYQMTLPAQQQQWTQQQQGQMQQANLSGYYTPTTGGMLGSGVSIQQIDQALQNSLGRDYNQNVFQAMTRGLQGQNLANPNATAAVNAAIQAASQGRLQDASQIAGQLGQGGYTAASPQQTMAMQQQQFQQALAQSGVTGMYVQPGTGPQAGQTSWDQLSQQLQAAGATNDAAAKALYQQYTQGNGQGAFAGNQTNNLNQAQMNAIWNAAGGGQGQGGQGGLGGGQMTTQYQQQLFNQALQTAQFQQGTAQNYLQLLSQLQGPADYGQYLKVLGSTPGGIRDLVGAAAGAYIPGGGTTGQPQAQNLNTLVGAGTSGVSGGGGYTPAQAQSNGSGAPPPGQFGSIAPGTTTSYQDYMAQAQNLPSPSQLSPQAMAQMTTSQKQMLQGMYGQLGYNQQDVQDLFNQSLPKYAAGGAGVQTGSYRLV